VEDLLIFAEGVAGMRCQIVVIAPLLLLCGCGKSVAGKYQCDGIPGMTVLELRSDGTSSYSGTMLDHPVTGTGTYAADGGHITVKSDVKTFGSGDSKTVLDERKAETTFEKQANGDLKWILATCKKM
jgi:hypothetical protein